MTRIDDLDGRLAAWASALHPGSAVADVAPLPGNSGLSYSFALTRPDAEPRRLVVRFAPPSVRRQGNTDVLRQVPLLRALADAGIPVARILWWESDSEWFGTDAFVQEHVDGQPLHIFDERLSVAGDADAMASMVSRAVEALVAIHAVDWRAALPDWGSPRSVVQELAFWDGFRDRMAESAWSVQAEALGQALRATAPEDDDVGLFHGDYQTNNVLFSAEHDLLAVIDWEIAGIGPSKLDLAWLAIMTDATCWHEEYAQLMRVHIEPSRLLESYVEAGGQPNPRFGWWQALACFRFAVIGGMNLRLHRTGKRPDPMYEVLATSIPVLLRRGLEFERSAR
jgi:aminoglycoside phosphotransferase (APT) family kinase protein